LTSESHSPLKNLFANVHHAIAVILTRKTIISAHAFTMVNICQFAKVDIKVQLLSGFDASVNFCYMHQKIPLLVFKHQK
jgi:hypothetical protein